MKYYITTRIGFWVPGDPSLGVRASLYNSLQHVRGSWISITHLHFSFSCNIRVISLIISVFALYLNTSIHSSVEYARQDQKSQPLQFCNFLVSMFVSSVCSLMFILDCVHTRQSVKLNIDFFFLLYGS